MIRTRPVQEKIKRSEMRPARSDSQGAGSRRLICLVRYDPSETRGWTEHEQLRSDKAKKQRGARRASIEIGYALCHDREEVTAKNAARNWKIFCPPTNPRQKREMEVEFREKPEP